MSKHRYTSKIIIRDDYVKNDGASAISLKVRFNGKSKVIPLNIFVQP